ncbi:hypothetical protein TNCV_4835561 [Trichonephila clavipes]|nr:hypothetical protein TNCV_4835561 [Trichonephila clavipes]
MDPSKVVIEAWGSIQTNLGAVDSLVVRASDSRPEGLVPCLNCGGGDCGGVAIYRSFGNFAEIIRIVTCMVRKANDRRTSNLLPR